MDAHDHQQRLWFALRHLIDANGVLQKYDGVDPGIKRELRRLRDNAQLEVESYLPPDALKQLACRRDELRKAAGERGEEFSDFADTALVIGIATAASILIAPFGAWIVAESIIKELVKAAVTGLFVGAATAAAQTFVDRRRDETIYSPELNDKFALAAEDVAEKVISINRQVSPLAEIPEEERLPMPYLNSENFKASPSPVKKSLHISEVDSNSPHGTAHEPPGPSQV